MEEEKKQNAFDCQVCLDSYNDKENKPMVMVCGHTTCKSCVSEIFKRNILEPLKCPICRSIQPYVAPDDVPINYGLMNVLQDRQYQCSTHPNV